MRIETWHLNHYEQNPAWKAVKELREWCQTVSLDPNTVKTFSSLSQIVERTALGRVFPLTSIEHDCLTPKEQKLICGYPAEISRTPKLAIIDLDGVMVSIWPTLKDFWHRQTHSCPSFRDCLEETKPSWTSLLPLGDLARRVDKLILWTSRFSPDQDSLAWELAKGVFGDLGSFDAFPFLFQEKTKKIERHFFPGKTQVIAGKIKGLSQSSFDQITRTMEGLGDPYCVYVGSSLFDIFRFKHLIGYLQKKELPFDRTVFCTNCHLIF